MSAVRATGVKREGSESGPESKLEAIASLDAK